jgi:diguanylate cyclase (GGDEF)-like protein/PAS domain S-box-containing protein
VPFSLRPDPLRPASRRAGRASSWAPFLAGLLGLGGLVTVLTLQLIEHERGQRREMALRHVEDLARLASVRVTQVLDAAAGRAPGSARYSEARLQTAPDGTWQVRLAVVDADRGAATTPPPGRTDSVSLPVTAFDALLAQAASGRDGAATIRTTDLRLVQRHPPPPPGSPLIGGQVTSLELREILARQPDQGSYAAVVPIDGIARVNAYQRVPGTPFIVLVGVPERVAPEGWSRHDLPILTLAVIALLIATGGTFWLYRLSLQRVSQAQRRWQSIVEDSEDAIITKALDGTVLDWNSAAERILGWSAAERVGLPILSIVPPERHGEEAAIMEKLARGERIEGLETLRVTKDGRLVPLSMTISPIRDAADRVVGACSISRDISRQKALEAEIRQQALMDPLTRLPNRRLFADRLAQAQVHGRRSGEWHALLFLDLDGFKALNDTHGHAAGDRCLEAVARRLTAAVRVTDTVARLGGDEFIVLCEGLGPEEAQARLRLLSIVRKIEDGLGEPLDLGGVRVALGASIGHVLFQGTVEDGEELVRRADQAMYRVKQGRRREAAAAPTAPA